MAHSRPVSGDFWEQSHWTLSVVLRPDARRNQSFPGGSEHRCVAVDQLHECYDLSPREQVSLSEPIDRARGDSVLRAAR